MKRQPLFRKATLAVRRHPWVAVVVVFLFGSSGSVWSYLDYRRSERDAYREDTSVARQLQADMTEIQRQILASVPRYLTARDVVIASAQSEDDGDAQYDLQNAYSRARVELSQLVMQYNGLEARRALLERMQPRWFPIGPMIPPLAPRLRAPVQGPVNADGTVTVTLVADPAPEDGVLLLVREDLKRLFEANRQTFQNPPPETVSVGRSPYSNTVVTGSDEPTP
jgi:hypothetical protein